VPDDLPRVVIDTNVWISAFINAGGGPAKVLDAFWADRFVPVVAQELLDEIQAVLHRPRIRRVPYACAAIPEMTS
jgi:putative PIN family toxin of toxin-antitoxin system